MERHRYEQGLTMKHEEGRYVEIRDGGEGRYRGHIIVSSDRQFGLDKSGHPNVVRC